MSTSWRDDDEDFKVGGVKGGLRSKPRFSLTEVKMLLDAVKRNRYIILRKFNQGVSAEAKKQTWTEITNQINGLGENHREVRQIMKKWADLKCDGKRRIVALRGPNGNTLRKKNLGPVERMVHKILMMSPRGDGESDPDIDEDDFPKPYSKPYSYLSLTDGPHSLPGGASFELSPLSSPEKEIGDPLHSSSEFDLEMGDDGERTVDFDENDDSSLFSSHPSSLPPPSSLDPLPDNVLPRVKPVYTYSRNSSQNHNHIQNHNYSRSVASTSSAFPPLSDSDALPPPPPPPLSQSPANSGRPAPSSSTPVAAGDSTSVPAPPATSAAVTAAPSSFVSSAGLPQPPPPSFSSSSVLPPTQPPGSGSSSDPLPAGASSSGRPLDNVVQMASQSLQQQRASRMLLTSVSQSMEVLAQSVQLLVESQQEFVQESLLLQRETVDILRDFSNTALTMLRDKSNSGHLGTHHLPSSHS